MKKLILTICLMGMLVVYGCKKEEPVSEDTAPIESVEEALISEDTTPTEPVEPSTEDISAETLVSLEGNLENTKIAFVSTRDRNEEIYVMNTDGSGQKNLTNNPADDTVHHWSPDGKRITFISDRDGRSRNYVMNADGSGQKRLMDDHATGWAPVWSPDGRKMAFFSKRDGNDEIYVMNADGSERKNLTNNPADDLYPSWSPDGTKITFTSTRDGKKYAVIYVMNADGSEQKRLTNKRAKDTLPLWSPDGKKIAFISRRDGNDEIYVMNADGSGQRNLTNNPAIDTHPSWSPDGKKIAFWSDRDGKSSSGPEQNYEIYVVNADGSGQKRLTNNPGLDYTICWSPDGKRIAFASERDENLDIYVMNANGSGKKRLTRNPTIDNLPSWSPFLASEPQSAEEPGREQEAVDDIDSRPQPVASDTQPEEPVETVPLPKPDDIVTNSIGMKLVYIPAGSFMMGSGDSATQLAKEYNMEEELFKVEFPQHQVHISEGFWMGQTEVTQSQYKSVMNAQPWVGNDYIQENANNPAAYVSWDEAAEFCTKLSQQEGKTYRLPTEAEWEYACRAGTTTRFSFGDSDSSLGDHAWFRNNTLYVDQGYAHSVGQKKPNPWDLYDMHGNIMEWCSDWYDEYYYSNSPSVDPKGPSSRAIRSLRGGSWLSLEYALRCSFRFYGYPYSRYSIIGFRVVRSQP